LTYGKEKWEGNGYYPLPTVGDHLAELLVVACKAVVAGMKALTLVPERPKLSVHWNIVALGGPAAARVQGRFDKLPVDDHRQIVWQPVGTVTGWGVVNGE